MTFDLVTLVAIRRRMESVACDMVASDAPLSAPQVARIARIMGWLGFGGRQITQPYALSRAIPTDRRRAWSKGGRFNSKGAA